MTRERAAALLPIIQAYAEGRTIQSKGHTGVWFDVNKDSFQLSMLDVVTEVRIKPKKKYRPFANAEEFKPHRDRLVIGKGGYSQYSILVFNDERVWLHGFTFNYHELNRDYTFDDGTPCGVEVEE